MPQADDHNARRRALADRVSSAVLDSEQTTSTSLRHAVASRGDVPEALAAWVAKIHEHAYKVVDEDYDALRGAGYDDDASFELTVSAALGAGMARLRAGLAAIEEAD